MFQALELHWTCDLLITFFMATFAIVINMHIMKKLLAILVFITACVSLNAQYATPQIAKRAGCTIKLDGEKLSREEAVELLRDIDGEDYSAEWCNARGWRTAGIVMMSAGGAVAVAGASTALTGALVSIFGAVVGGATGAIVGSVGGSDSAQKTGGEAAESGAKAGVPLINTGLVIGAVGAVAAIAGIPITVVNCKRMTGIVDKYNAAQTSPAESAVPAAELTFGPTSNGVGLSLRF